MTSFFEGINFDDAEMIETLSRVTYELRENRKLILDQYELEDVQLLLNKITSGEIAEHPAYEHYLSANILSELHDTVRAELAEFVKGVRRA